VTVSSNLQLRPVDLNASKHCFASLESGISSDEAKISGMDYDAFLTPKIGIQAGA